MTDSKSIRGGCSINSTKLHCIPRRALGSSHSNPYIYTSAPWCIYYIRSSSQSLSIVTSSAMLLVLVHTSHSCPVLPGLPGRDGRDCTVAQPKQPRGLSYSNPIERCSDVIEENSHSSDGWYWIRDASNRAKVVC